MADVTKILNQIEQGDPAAAEQLLPLVYDELRKLAAARLSHEKPGQTLQATALVHEAYLRLLGDGKPVDWNSRGHFFGAAAEAMRRILIEQARRKKSLKGGGKLNRLELGDQELPGSGAGFDLLALDEALKRLEESDPRSAQVVKLRFFGGLTIKQTAEAMGISTATADNDWAYARSWLRVQMDDGD